MKIVINYFDKTAIISTAQEAVDFINSLHYREKLVCNSHTENLLVKMFNGEVLPAYNKPFSEYYSLSTTGCGNTNINLYSCLADTLEAHNEIVAKNKAEATKIEAVKRNEREQAHLEQMHEHCKGWYVVTITGNAFKLRGNDGSVTKSVKVLADNKMDAYNKSIQNLEENPPKNVMNWYGFESSKSALIEYVGTWTDEAEIEYNS
jgi:hypothetical protein